jgi:hypothetical protein
MPSAWGLYPRFERSRGLNAKVFSHSAIVGGAE